jgi:hypothetical protein
MLAEGSSMSMWLTSVFQGCGVVNGMEQAIMFHFLIAIPNLVRAPTTKSVGGLVPGFWKASTGDYHERSP